MAEEGSKYCPQTQNPQPWEDGVVAASNFEYYMGLNLGPVQRYPGRNAINRPYVLTDGQANALIAKGKAGADEWYAIHRPKMIEARYAIAHLGPNEPPVDTIDQRLALAVFYIRLWELMKADGLPLGVGCFSRGTPQLKAADPTSTAWYELLPVVDIAMAEGNFLCVHQYGPKNLQDDWVWYAGRHELFIPELESLGVDVDKLRLLITEGGIDTGNLGWKTVGISEAQYAEQLLWADRRYEQWHQIKAWAPYIIGPDKKWATFEITEWLLRQMASDSLARPPRAIQQEVPTVTLPIDGRYMTISEFESYVATLDLDSVDCVVIHHTASPTEEDWDKWGGWSHYAQSMKAYYESLGWTKGPHLFVDQNGVGLFYDLTKDGRAVGGGALEAGCRHIEIVGNFTDHMPDTARMDNAATVAAAILDAANLGIESLTNHHDLTAGGSECPGATLRAHWGEFVALVEAKMDSGLEASIAVASQAYVIPLNPEAALGKFLSEHGLLPASDEIYFVYKGITYLAQVGRKVDDLEHQYIAYAESGHWDDIKLFLWDN